MADVLIYFDAKQKQGLARRARLHRKSFSQEVRNAVDFYLSISIESEEELSALARAANLAADRMIRQLDETVAYLREGLRPSRKSR